MDNSWESIRARAEKKIKRERKKVEAGGRVSLTRTDSTKEKWADVIIDSLSVFGEG